MIIFLSSIYIDYSQCGFLWPTSLYHAISNVAIRIVSHKELSFGLESSADIFLTINVPLTTIDDAV